MMKRWYIPLQKIILACLLAAASALAQPLNPVAHPRSVIAEGNARFTVLTPELIRMEWSGQRQFEDRASLVFINRRLEPPHFTTRKDSGWLVIQTDRLRLDYFPDGNPFSSSNLHISFEMNGKSVQWYPGLEDRGNLGGTIRTLDGVRGETKLEPGILSKDGWVLVDDSDRPLFDNSDWPWVAVRSSTKYQDWYFFGYGHDYRKAMLDFTKVAGKIPMPPRFAFGLWWSRVPGRTPMRNLKILSPSSGYTTSRSMCLSLTWTGTKRLICGGDVRQKIRQGRCSDGQDTRGTEITFRILKVSSPGATVKD